MTSKESKIVDGTCEFCKVHDKLSALEPEYIYNLADKLRKKRGYHVLIGISGGLDSSYLLWYTVNILQLKPLVIHFNNRWNDPVATENMNLLVEKLGFDFIQVTSGEEYDELCGAFLKSGVKDLDIPNDLYMADFMLDVAFKYKIKYIFNGHDYRYEGSTPLAWTYMDTRYLNSVYYKHTGQKLKDFPLYTFKRQIISGIKGIKHVRPFHHLNITDFEKKNTMLDFGWKDYGVKHGENVYTKFIGYYVLPRRWKIDKRKVYLSAQIRSGVISKAAAKRELENDVYFDEKWFPEIENRTGVFVRDAMNAPRRTYKDFDHYNFKKWKPLLWVMAKLRMIPYHFYKKYAD